ncbi:hypothetical protein ACE38V_17515 [Cytobacillus sp. Hz8]|uniref:hypothetical protein n=1 Tax=Cytobacillus sp. Hz8 TaxID=3347168 RepID=UPI0035E19421
MKYIYYVLSLIPVAFLFHFYEYGQQLKGEEARYLFPTWLIYILIIGLLSVYIKKRNILLFQIISCVISVLLAKLWIADDGGWFTPFGRDVAVVWIAGITCIGQLIIRTCLKAFKRNDKLS